MAQYTSQQVAFGRVFANLLLGALKTVPGAALLATGKVRLSKDPSFSPAADTSLATLEANECDFSGYPAGGVAVSLTIGVNVTPQIQGAITSATFEAATASPFVPNQCYGYWIDDGTEMAIGEAFGSAGPIPFADVGDYLVLNAAIPEALLQPAA
jgi:hypothetical protein